MTDSVVRVLVGFDFSEGAQEALRSAAAVAKSMGGIVHVTHVIAVDEMEADKAILKYREDLRRVLLVELAAAAKDVGVSGDISNWEASVGVGDATSEMLKLAEEISASFVVVGHRGKGLLKRTLLGSVAAKMLRESQKPILITRGNSVQHEGGVLAPVDLKEGSVEIIQAAHRWAHATNAPLTVLYTLEVSGLTDYHSLAPSIPMQDVVSDAPQDVQASLQKLVAQAIGEDANVKIEVKLGTPAYEVVFAAERSQSRIVVMGSRNRKGLSKLFLGNTADRVVEHAPCDVLVVKI